MAQHFIGKITIPKTTTVEIGTAYQVFVRPNAADPTFTLNAVLFDLVTGEEIKCSQTGQLSEIFDGYTANSTNHYSGLFELVAFVMDNENDELKFTFLSNENKLKYSSISFYPENTEAYVVVEASITFSDDVRIYAKGFSSIIAVAHAARAHTADTASALVLTNGAKDQYTKITKAGLYAIESHLMGGSRRTCMLSIFDLTLPAEVQSHTFVIDGEEASTTFTYNPETQEIESSTIGDSFWWRLIAMY